MRPQVALCTILITGLAVANGPRVLIVQTLSDPDSAFENNVWVASDLARELQRDGRVEPIIWSSTDRTLTATLESLRVSFAPNPDRDTIERTRRLLGAEFVIILEAIKKEGVAQTRVDVFRNGGNRPIWTFRPDDARQGPPKVFVNGREDRDATRSLAENLPPDSRFESGGFVALINGLPDWSSTSLSLARTWASALGEGPFRTYTRRPELDTRWQEGRLIPDWTLLPVANADWMNQITRHTTSGDPSGAITIARAAVDAAPFDIQRRIQLIKALQNAAHYRSAAVEAQKAAAQVGTDPVFWGLAAELLYRAGDPDAAEAALNQALARGFEGPEVLLLRADIAFAKGDFERALPLYAELSNPAAIYSRTLCNALNGVGTDEIVVSLAPIATLPVEINRYQGAMFALERWWITQSSPLNELITQARISPELSAAAIRTELQRTDAIVAFLRGTPIPDSHRTSHEARILAYIMLGKALAEARSAAELNDPDLAVDALISFGEARRTMDSMRDVYTAERRLAEADAE